MRTRTEIINALVEANAYLTYLEIGVEYGGNLEAINCMDKIGVDPNPIRPVYRNARLFTETSDEFFAKFLDTRDIIFIDGLHTEEQSYIDARNALKIMNPCGVVVMHDALPHDKYVTRPYADFLKDTRTNWCGDVWAAVLRLAYMGGLRVQILDTDWGVAVIHEDSSVPARELPVVLTWDEHRPMLDEFVVKELNLLPVAFDRILEANAAFNEALFNEELAETAND